MSNFASCRRYLAICLALYTGLCSFNLLVMTLNPSLSIGNFALWNSTIGFAALMQGLTSYLLWKNSPKAVFTSIMSDFILSAGTISLGVFVPGALIWQLALSVLIWLAVAADDSNWRMIQTRFDELKTNE